MQQFEFVIKNMSDGAFGNAGQPVFSKNFIFFVKN
jgi:hypothetical protein